MSAATKLDGLCVELLEASSEPRVFAIASRILAVAMQLHQQEAAIVPPHLREPERELPPGVVPFRARRRAWAAAWRVKAEWGGGAGLMSVEDRATARAARHPRPAALRLRRLGREQRLDDGPQGIRNGVGGHAPHIGTAAEGLRLHPVRPGL